MNMIREFSWVHNRIETGSDEGINVLHDPKADWSAVDTSPGQGDDLHILVIKMIRMIIGGDYSRCHAQSDYVSNEHDLEICFCFVLVV
jgi:hypothetical protein